VRRGWQDQFVRGISLHGKRGGERGRMQDPDPHTIEEATTGIQDLSSSELVVGRLSEGLPENRLNTH